MRERDTFFSALEASLSSGAFQHLVYKLTPAGGSKFNVLLQHSVILSRIVASVHAGVCVGHCRRQHHVIYFPLKPPILFYVALFR